MRIISKATLRAFWQRHPPAAGPLQSWYALVAASEWRRPADVRNMFGTTVDFVAGNRLVFNIGGNKYRLIVHVSYPYGRVLIKFIGTHAEYDRIDAGSV